MSNTCYACTRFKRQSVLKGFSVADHVALNERAGKAISMVVENHKSIFLFLTGCLNVNCFDQIYPSLL